MYRMLVDLGSEDLRITHRGERRGHAKAGEGEHEERKTGDVLRELHGRDRAVGKASTSGRKSSQDNELPWVGLRT